MLTPEQAQLHLKASQISDVEQWRLKAIARLPDEPLNEDIRQTFIKAMTQKQPIPDAISLRGMAYGLISRNIDGTSIEYTLRNSYELRRDVVNGSQNAMLLLTSDERLQLFKTFFPKVAVYIEQLWQYLPTLPYQSGYTRQAFRAPGHSERYDHLRVYLFHRFLGDVGLYNENLLWFAEHMQPTSVMGILPTPSDAFSQPSSTRAAKPLTPCLMCCWPPHAMNTKPAR